MALQGVNNTMEEALQWSYPPAPAGVPAGGRNSKPSLLAKALSDVSALEDVIDVTAVADSITVHVLQLLPDLR